MTNTNNGNGSGSPDRKKLALFVDYESLFWSYWHSYNDRPSLRRIMKILEEQGNCCRRMAFADFSDPLISAERVKLRGYAFTVVDCASPNQRQKTKNFTDFLMQDEIYGTIINELLGYESYDAYVLVTGDSDFISVVARLANLLDKEIGVVSLKESLSRALQEFATWSIFLPTTGELCGKAIKNLKNFADKNEVLSKPNFLDACQRFFGMREADKSQMGLIIDRLVKERCIDIKDVERNGGKQEPSLIPDFKRMEECGYYP